MDVKYRPLRQFLQVREGYHGIYQPTNRCFWVFTQNSISFQVELLHTRHRHLRALHETLSRLLWIKTIPFWVIAMISNCITLIRHLSVNEIAHIRIDDCGEYLEFNHSRRPHIEWVEPMPILSKNDINFTNSSVIQFSRSIFLSQKMEMIIVDWEMRRGDIAFGYVCQSPIHNLWMRSCLFTSIFVGLFFFTHAV